MTDKLTPKEVHEAAARSRENYAQHFITTAEHYNEHEVYDAMTLYTRLCHGAMQARHELPADRPIVHIDIGMGTGHLLEKLAAHFRETDRKHYLIGLEVNEILARHAVGRLRAAGNRVETHIRNEEKIEHVNRKLVLRQRYPLDERTIDGMNLSADNSGIVVIQDDARRKLEILTRVLAKLQKNGISHVDSISFGMPGVSGALAMQDTPDLHLPHDTILKRQAGTLVNELTARTCRLAQEVLGVGGSLILFQRMRSGDALRRIFEERMQMPWPQDNPDLQMFFRVELARALLGKNAPLFHTRSGAVLYENFHEVEHGTQMDFVSFAGDGGTNAWHQVPTADLFGLSLVRSDLHNPGTHLGVVTVAEQ